VTIQNLIHSGTVVCVCFGKGNDYLESKVGSMTDKNMHWGGARVCRNAVLHYFWCGFAAIFFNMLDCGFNTLSGLQLLQPLSRSFWWKKSVCANNTLYNSRQAVGIQLSCKREPSVLFYNVSGFIISAYNLTQSMVSNYCLFQLIHNVINFFGCFGQWCVNFVKFHAGC